jgi:undecaprenyl-diphosphatase
VIRALVLGIVQGLTEFLPISSSAHLSIVPRLLGYQTPTLAFEVLLHFGTLAAVTAYFARDLWAFLLSLVAPSRLGPSEARTRRRLLALLALASVPAAVVGYLVQDWADTQTARPLRASIWLVATTAIMIAAELYAKARNAPKVAATTPATKDSPQPTTPTNHERDRPPGAAHRPTVVPGERWAAPGGPTPGGPTPGGPTPGGPTPDGPTPGGPRTAEEELERLPAAKAAGIGLAQALALIPGTSRSGVTISAGLFEGISRETAARFSFLLSIPAILGAGLLKLDDLSGAAETPAELLVGTLAAAISGFVAVSFLLRMLRTRTLWPFIWYRLVAGSLFVVLLATIRS